MALCWDGLVLGWFYAGMVLCWDGFEFERFLCFGRFWVWMVLDLALKGYVLVWVSA